MTNCTKCRLYVPKKILVIDQHLDPNLGICYVQSPLLVYDHLAPLVLSCHSKLKHAFNSDFVAFVFYINTLSFLCDQDYMEYTRCQNSVQLHCEEVRHNTQKKVFTYHLIFKLKIYCVRQKKPSSKTGVEENPTGLK